MIRSTLWMLTKQTMGRVLRRTSTKHRSIPLSDKEGGPAEDHNPKHLVAPKFFPVHSLPGYCILNMLCIFRASDISPTTFTLPAMNICIGLASPLIIAK